jgi:hypothetical protein
MDCLRLNRGQGYFFKFFSCSNNLKTYKIDKNVLVPYLGIEPTITHQKPNLSRETVPLKSEESSRSALKDSEKFEIPISISLSELKMC